MSENHKCRLFWKAIPPSLRALTDYDLHNYCNLKTEVIIAEREYLCPRSLEIDSDEYPEEENLGALRGEPSSNIEEDPEEDPEENPGETTN